jgi:radical SAM protein with 4Fe4S-binding SPASM domain
VKHQNKSLFFARLQAKKNHFPFSGQLELTYRCNLDCIHCYCKGSENDDKELDSTFWCKTIDDLQKEGGLNLTFSGGEPLLRKDFLEIYSYAKRKGFIITLFTNGQFLDKKLVDYFVNFPPFSIEITLDSLNKNNYETITQKKNSFKNIMKNINNLARTNLPVVIKANCLKQNKNEIGAIKRFAQEMFGKKSSNGYCFKYDPMLFTRINGDKTPCNYRLTFEELLEVRKQDSDFWHEYKESLHGDFPTFNRRKNALYKCNVWLKHFFINPFGRLKFCVFSEKFSVDLTKDSFKYGFYEVFPQLLKKSYKTKSKCRYCALIPICGRCPARAYLETGKEEAPIEYFCDLAHKLHKELLKVKKNDNAALQ